MEAAGPAGFDEIADRLYALHPDAFAAARDEQVKLARAAGQRPLAAALAALRRPTSSAWALNQLARDQRDVLDQLTALADGMAAAQAHADAAALRSLMAARRAVETALTQRAQALAQAAGVTVTAAMVREVQDTLNAALALPEVAAELRAGRLTKPVAYAGFGDASLGWPTPPAPLPRPPIRLDRRPNAPPATGRQGDEAGVAGEQKREARAAAEREAKAMRAREADAVRAREAEAARAREAEAARTREMRAAAERDVEAAHAALDAAASALAEATATVDAARQRQQEVAEEAELLRAQLRALELALLEAHGRAAAAAERADDAAAAHEAALRSHERARQRLQELTKGP